MTEEKTRIPCSQHPKWEWPHCGAPPADPQFERAEMWLDPGDDHMPVPSGAMESDFSDAPELEEMATHLVRSIPELRWLSNYRWRVLWKAKGGDKLGRCVLVTELLQFFADLDWVIWIAADNTYAGELTRSQMQALLYHELKHCELKGPKLTPGIRKHDSEVFIGEVARFGAWRSDLDRLALAFRLYDSEARLNIDALLAGATDVTPDGEGQ